MARTLIENGYLVTMNPARDVHPGGFVVIDGNTIERIGPAGKVPRDEIFDRTLDAGGMIVVPGLINAHQHFYYHLFKGLANGLLLEDWFPQLVFPVADHLTDDDMELTSYLAAIEMLLGGTTCCLHHLRTTTDEKTLTRIVQPTIELGFRQVVGKEIQCRLEGNPDHPRDIAEEMEFVEDLILRWHGSNDEIVQMCLVAECNAIFMDQKVTSEALLIESKRLADRHNLKLATHISGGTLSFDKSYMQVLRKTGLTDTGMLMRMGLLDSSWVLIHGINCTQNDLEMIADAGASFVYTPTSEAARGGGFGPAAWAQGIGVNVALGTDGPMVDYSVDMVEQMKACLLVQNAKHLDPTVMSPERCLEMATINAARALGLDDKIGSIETGKLADIAVFDLNTPHASPAANPISSLVMSARGTDAHCVFVNGTEVVREKQLTTFHDTKTVLAAVTKRAKEISDKAGLTGRTMPRWPR